MIRCLKECIELPISIKEAWDFFSDPNNLSVITPPELGFEITSGSISKTYPGQIITYSVRPLFGIPMQWVTEITHVEEEKYFVDEQRIGPYRMWHHQHRFSATAKGTLIEDIVDYVMPYGILGDAVHFIFVKKQITSIFSYRKEALQKRFGRPV